MTGYVRTLPSDLRLRDQECYKALYCGLCRNMGKCTGNCSRLSLSYDFVFLAAVRMLLLCETPKPAPFRCLIHPTRKRTEVKDSPTLLYCADASALLIRGKTLDDRRDEAGWRRARAIGAGMLFSKGGRRAEGRYPELAAQIDEGLADLRRYEADPASPPELFFASSFFGRMMADVFSFGLEGTEERIASSLGDAVGRWIYLVDALDDLYEDRKRGRFNPILRLFGGLPNEENLGLLRLTLDGYLSSAKRAAELIGRGASSELSAIVDNILALGLPAVTEKTFQTYREQNPSMKGTESE